MKKLVIPFSISVPISFLIYLLNISCFSLMGAGFSGSSSNNEGCSSSKSNLGDLPEICISSICKFLDPPDVCKLAMLNRAFRAASLADFVWVSKLPWNYKFLAHKVFGESADRMGKREIYARLCRFNRIDGGTKEVWLDKCSGKTCVSISPKGLKITGIDDRRYWNYIPSDESRFGRVAYLQQVWWFEVIGELEFEFAPGTYSIFFRLQLGKASKRFGRRVCNLEQVHGWNIRPVRFHLSTSTGQHALFECYLDEPGQWIHYHVGDFAVENIHTPIRVKFSMIQIDCTHTKGGLCIDSVLICPVGFNC